MIINNDLLDQLTAQAKNSPRLRVAYDLRTTPDDQSQRMLNAMEPGMSMPIHRHTKSSETVIMLRGKAEWHYYDEVGNVIKSITVESGSDTIGLSVPKGQWHNTICLKSGTVIMEAKNGSYEPLTEEDILNKSTDGH